MIGLSVLDGFVDSIKNIYVIFYIDKTINQKLEKEQINQAAKKKSNKEKTKE